ncbi:MAG: outer membrane protein transport protein [Nitrospirota bacterium]|nr:outer membrane protein transport protein [Nitrospirota bacterium]
MWAFTVCAFLAINPSLTFAEAFRILDQSAAATGQGTAFAAQADDASAVYFNPAAMTRLSGIQFIMGTLLVGGSFEFQPTSSGTVHGDLGGPIANPPPSNMFVTANLGSLGIASLKHVTVGLGLNSPFGNLTRYPKNVPLSAVITSSASPLLDIKPTVAFELNEFISMGFGLDIYTFSGLFGEGQVELQQVAGADLAATGLVLLGDEVELNGTDTAIGYNMSLLLTPLRNPHGQPLVNFAVVYRSHTELNLEGEFINLTQGTALGARAKLNLPQVVTLGMAVWPVRTSQREWKVEVDFDYADWTSFKNLDVGLSNGLIIPKPKDWQSSYTLMLGTEYKIFQPTPLPHWEFALRGGYVFADSPVPERTFSPDVPDANYHAISIGMGLVCKDQGLFLGFIECGNSEPEKLGITGIGIDLAYQAILYQSRGIQNNVDPLGRVNGTWDTTLHVGALSLRIIFDLGH